MEREYSVSLQSIIEEHGLEVIHLPVSEEKHVITCADVNRPGLVLTGYMEYFDSKRIQVLGKSEFAFLNSLAPEIRAARLDDMLALEPPAVVVTRHLDILPELEAACGKYDVPLLRTADTTSAFVAALIAYLNVQLAPRITRHGVLVEVYGEGILLVGDSGVGKSETAIELIKRGHRLVADDAVDIKRVSA
ncbi:MAG: HPr kinase/phosphorylase, partial [Clostridia bacterium]|nr:HPr kinase/phosphorylase [Clostridia bacterium]